MKRAKAYNQKSLKDDPSKKKFKDYTNMGHRTHNALADRASARKKRKKKRKSK